MVTACQSHPQSQTRTPIVTVILMVFRRTCYLEAAIRSVLQQTFEDLDLIVTDDADSDDAKQICARFSSDSRLRYRANPTTLGAPLNVAAAIVEARGAYLVILNDDDLLCPQMLEQLVPPLNSHPQVVVAFGNHAVMDANGVVLTSVTADLMIGRGRNKLTPGLVPNVFAFAVRANVMAVMGCVFRRSAVDPAWLVHEVRGAYDYWLSIKLSQQGEFYFVNETVMAWRQHSDSVSSTISHDIYSGAIHICERLLTEQLPPDLNTFVKARLAGFYFKRGLVYLDQGWSISASRNLLYRSWKSKWSTPAFRYWIATFAPASVRRLLIHAWRAIRAGGSEEM